MNRLPIPLMGAGAILGTLMVLVLVVTLRPWAGPDNSANTLLNLGDAPPAGYGRTPLTWVDGEPKLLRTWHPTSETDSDYSLEQYVGNGCVSCHGLDGKGGPVGPDLSDLSASDIRKALKKGPGGMPAFSTLDQDQVDAVIAFLTGKRPVAAATPQVPAEPTPTVVAAAVAAPTSVPTGSLSVSAPTPIPVDNASVSQGSLDISALHIINSTGFHQIDADIRAAESLADVNPLYLDRVRNALMVSQAASYPPILSREVEDFEEAAQALADALSAGDLATAKLACEDAHRLEHILSHAAYDWLTEHQGKVDQGMPAAVSVSTALDIINTAGFHALYEESRRVLTTGDLAPRYLDRIRYAINATKAAPYPAAVNGELSTFQRAAEALVDALSTGDLFEIRVAASTAHEAQHRLSHATYDWLAEEQIEAAAKLPSTKEAASEGGPIIVEAVQAAITVDGDTSDWTGIPTIPVTLQQINPLPGIEMGKVDPIDLDMRVAVDDERVYVLVEVHDDYDYVPDDHGLSAAMAVMFRIDDPAAPHMGTTEEDQRKSLGKVDIWHWELDCGPGIISGGVTGIRGGNDPQCNLDDEWAETPTDLEDDGSTQAENSLAGAWRHTSQSEGAGAPGTWIFEISRLLQTGDPDDAQLSAGTTANMALAYWDADETPDGWTSGGHLQSASGGWIEVVFP